MLPETIDTSISLLESDNTQLNLVRWMHQCELMKRYYEANVVFIIQETGTSFEVIVSSISQSRQFTTGTSFDRGHKIFQRLIRSLPDGLNIDLTNHDHVDLHEEFNQAENLLTRPILWPDGTHFGCICVLNAEKSTAASNSFMLEPFQVLLQQELTLYCQTQRIESLSMRDRETGMLNQYGFIMMAPRQLSLGRRFGAHAGIIFFELYSAHTIEHIEEKHHRLLGSIIQDTIRTADIAAHYDDNLFVVLVFVDSERDLLHISKRVDKLIFQQNDQLKVDSSCNYFTPDSTLKLAPMLEASKQGLKSEKIKLAAQAAKLEAPAET
ncbi:nucleotidyl cyclase domain-containing protein [Shewanella violacea]|uniref:GGDEF domain protein n=1 Tax=Shewanella violacea (strain JCM 10179 / CIP 106290 / LMG 19151 / DSS12) TaxID=637905 RepID=D4ZG82_SHEVD|nr:GGDEF domain-containing protein [Shewanella violacea]BAJ00681.1 GGDEF domain protein [Shewanella violacea DSS12]